jgi:hypothetical protein
MQQIIRKLQFINLNIEKISKNNNFLKKQYCFYERTIIMKKLAYLATAVLAGLGFTSTASADVSISGSQTLMYCSFWFNNIYQKLRFC